MLGIGFFELVIIAIVCFIAIGPKQLPAVMRKLAHFYRQFAQLREDFRFQIMSADDLLEPKQSASEKPEKAAEEIVVVPRDSHHG